MLMVSNAVGIMSCTLDAIVLEDNRRPTILEIKSMSSMTGWEGDTIPEYYLIQILHQMFVTGFRKAILLARFRCSEDMAWPGREKIYTINREDYETTICSIAEKINEFWKKHIAAGVPPNAVLPEV
jgi:predicted phage-related endonuclease